MPTTTEAKAYQFADRVIAERAPAGEPIEGGAAFKAFVAACRHAGNLGSRKAADRHLPAYERAFWHAVFKRACDREITATNRSVAAYDAAQT